MPLCADGFSGFYAHDPHYREMNDTLKTATNHLLYDLIPGPFPSHALAHKGYTHKSSHTHMLTHT